MSRNKTLLTIAVAVLLGTLFSCKAPVYTDAFVRAADADENGCYRFALDLSDSLCTYDVYLYTKVDGGDLHTGIPFNIRWKSPAGEVSGDVVYWNPKDTKALYRSGVKPAERGEWDLSIAVLGNVKVRGLGVILEKKYD